MGIKRRDDTIRFPIKKYKLYFLIYSFITKLEKIFIVNYWIQIQIFLGNNKTFFLNNVSSGLVNALRTGTCAGAGRSPTARSAGYVTLTIAFFVETFKVTY